MDINDPIEILPSTRSDTFHKLNSLGILSVWDFLNYFPYRYEDYSMYSEINKLQPGEIVTVTGTITNLRNIYTKRGLTIQEMKLEDKTGRTTVRWFNQPYLTRMMKKDSRISVAGEVISQFKSLELQPKEFEIIKDNKPAIHTGRIVPVYSEKGGLSVKLIREKMFLVIETLRQKGNNSIPLLLPLEIVKFNGLMEETESYFNVHFPGSISEMRKARYRLGFDELFVIQLSAALIRSAWNEEKVGHVLKFDTPVEKKVASFMDQLPFKLTEAQLKAIGEILIDLQKSKPMNRFLEGDVGSGKTVVAAVASYLTFLNGFQTLFMAPTEILALQHYNTLSSLFSKSKVRVGIQTHTYKKTAYSQRSLKINTQVKDDIVVGTHALIGKKTKFDRIGLVVIDEQHRFGVAQRAELKEKGVNPHLLTMTATPIPRTIALTLFGELDLSVLDEMPKGRLVVKTYLVPQVKRNSGYEWIKKQIRDHKTQVFIVCPLIEESEVETMKSLRAAKAEYERLSQQIFKRFTVGLLHGKIKGKEKESIMQKFAKGEIDILVSTPVVEVGIDIPNASIMLIEGAERFGLAQLHQLRGRVGRGPEQSYCLLYTDSDEEKVAKRLDFFAKHQKGIEVAEYDLKLRGPGQIFGTHQHGYMDLKIASLSDYDLIKKSKDAVSYFLTKNKITEYPHLLQRVSVQDKERISRD